MLSREISFMDTTTNSSASSESGEFTVTSQLTPSTQATTLDGTGQVRRTLPYVEQYLNIYYKKTLNPTVSSTLSHTPSIQIFFFQMILTTGELVENILALYETMDDEAANSYILSFVLLRVGCSSKTYDFEQYIDLNRDEKEAVVKHVRPKTLTVDVSAVYCDRSRTGLERRSLCK